MLLTLLYPPSWMTRRLHSRDFDLQPGSALEVWRSQPTALAPFAVMSSHAEDSWPPDVQLRDEPDRTGPGRPLEFAELPETGGHLKQKHPACSRREPFWQGKYVND